MYNKVLTRDRSIFPLEKTILAFSPGLIIKILSSKKFNGLNYGVNGNVMYSESNLAFAWLNDTSGIFRGYPGAVFLRNQIIFNVDPFVNFFTQTNGKHHFRTRILHSDNEMTANQSNRSSTFYGDYMFQKTYENLKGIDFIGGLTGTFTSSFANLYSGGGDPTNELLNLQNYLSKSIGA